jgi:hypothetical protein
MDAIQSEITDNELIDELIVESEAMEAKMCQAARHFAWVSNSLFVPTLFLNLFICTFVLSMSCSVSVSTAISGCGSDGNECGQTVQNGQSDQSGQNGQDRVIGTFWYQYLLASMAFANAILAGLQKMLRPSETSESFQSVARRWGSLLRQVVSHRNTNCSATTADPWRARRLRTFVVTYSTLIEHSPFLPQWLLHKDTTKKQGCVIATQTRGCQIRRARRTSVRTLTSFLTEKS